MPLWWGFLVLLALISTTKIADYDFWWHLNLGRAVAGAGSPSVVDSFSYTFAGLPQFNGEWLADLIFYLAYSGGGLPMIAVLKFGVLAATFWFLKRVAERIVSVDSAGNAMAIISALTLILFAIRFRLFVRPFLFSFLFVAVFFWVLTLYRESRCHRLLWILPVVEIAWANTSKGVFFGPFLIGLWIIFDLCDRRLDRHLLIALPMVLAASLVSPEFLGPYRLLFNPGGMENVAVIGEHQPLTTALLWGGGLGYTWGFQVLVVLGLGYFVLMRGWRDLRALTLFSAFLLPAIWMVRMIDFFSLASIFAVTPAIGGLWGAIARLNIPKPQNWSWLVSLLLVLTGLLAVWASDTYAFGIGTVAKKTPEGAMTFIERNQISGRVFNSYPYGGYIPWRNPRMPVYIDGRINQLYPPEFHKHYYELMHTPQAWDAEEQKWGFEVAILEYDLIDGGRHFPQHLATNPGWSLVYWDDHSAVYLKRLPRFEELIKRYGYRLARPAFNQFDYLADAMRRMPRSELVEMLRDDARRNPNNQEPRLALSSLLFSLNPQHYREEIVAELQACLQLPPALAMEHSALGMLQLEQGDKEGAARQARLALAIDARDEGGLFLKGKLGL